VVGGPGKRAAQRLCVCNKEHLNVAVFMPKYLTR